MHLICIWQVLGYNPDRGSSILTRLTSFPSTPGECYDSTMKETVPVSSFDANLFQGKETLHHTSGSYASWKYFNFAAPHTVWVSWQSSTGCVSRVWRWGLNRRQHPQLYTAWFMGDPQCQLVRLQRQGERPSNKLLSTWGCTIVYKCIIEPLPHFWYLNRYSRNFTQNINLHNKEVPVLLQN
jgi:hypothetical protein